MIGEADKTVCPLAIEFNFLDYSKSLKSLPEIRLGHLW
jgi:hypothetical protein